MAKQLNTPSGKPKEQKTQTNNGVIRKLRMDLEIKSIAQTKVFSFDSLIVKPYYYFVFYFNRPIDPAS